MAFALTESEILSIWEAGRPSTPVERALLALQPVSEGQEAERWTVGERDALLFKVYAATFGPRLEGVTVCPECGEQLDVAFPAAGVGNSPETTADRVELVAGDPAYRIAVRIPCSADLLAVAGFEDPEMARRVLAEACIVSAERNGEAIAPAMMPDDLIDRIDEAMAAHDPASEVRLSMACPACAHSWQVTFDIVDFLWRVLTDRAQRLVVDVHVLARAYGWSEREILGMSRARRELYQELIW